MTTTFTVTAKGNSMKRRDNVSKGDVVAYAFDFTAWQEDNDTITSVEWRVESGQAGIGTPVTTDGVTEANITFSQSGCNLISILAITATVRKKVWLEVYAHDPDSYRDDYGAGS